MPILLESKIYQVIMAYAVFMEGASVTRALSNVTWAGLGPPSSLGGLVDETLPCAGLVVGSDDVVHDCTKVLAEGALRRLG